MSGELEIPGSGVYTPPPPQCAHFERRFTLEALRKLFCSFIYRLLCGFRCSTGIDHTVQRDNIESVGIIFCHAILLLFLVFVAFLLKYTFF